MGIVCGLQSLHYLPVQFSLSERIPIWCPMVLQKMRREGEELINYHNGFFNGTRYIMRYSEILDEDMMTNEVTRSMTRAICTQLSVTCTDDIRLYTLTDE